jgi:glycine hydroxymethyltransferase
VHLVLVDLRASELSGLDAEKRLEEINITVNRNAIPFDPRPPRVTSGLRLGSPAMVTRGLVADDFRDIGEIIGLALSPDFDRLRSDLLERVGAIIERYPLYADLAAPAAV